MLCILSIWTSWGQRLGERGVTIFTSGRYAALLLISARWVLACTYKNHELPGRPGPSRYQHQNISREEAVTSSDRQLIIHTLKQVVRFTARGNVDETLLPYPVLRVQLDEKSVLFFGIRPKVGRLEILVTPAPLKVASNIMTLRGALVPEAVAADISLDILAALRNHASSFFLPYEPIPFYQLPPPQHIRNVMQLWEIPGKHVTRVFNVEAANWIKVLPRWLCGRFEG